MSNLFASKFSQRVRDVSQTNSKNVMVTNVAALMVDSSAHLLRFLFDKVISHSRPLLELRGDPEAPERHVRDNLQSAWHASGTCWIGDSADARAVMDPVGKVVGAEKLIAARIAEMVRQR